MQGKRGRKSIERPEIEDLLWGLRTTSAELLALSELYANADPTNLSHNSKDAAWGMSLLMQRMARRIKSSARLIEERELKREKN